MTTHDVELADMPALAQRVKDSLRFPEVVYLHGELGAGKTTLARYLLQSLGYRGACQKSHLYAL